LADSRPTLVVSCNPAAAQRQCRQESRFIFSNSPSEGRDMKLRRMCVLLGVLLLVTNPAAARKWASRDGKFSIDAELVEVRDGVVRLKRQDGRIIPVPVSKLSKADRDYLASLTKAKSDAEVVQADVTRQSKAFAAGDVDTVVGFMHPLILKKLGGEDRIKSVLKKDMARYKAQGLKVDRSEFPEKPTLN
jgi:hypothetical protein